MTATKADLVAQRRGQGGTVVRLVVDPMTVAPIRNSLNRTFGAEGDHASSLPSVDLRRDTYVVADLYERMSFMKPDQIAIRPADLNVAFSVSLSDIEVVA